MTKYKVAFICIIGVIICVLLYIKGEPSKEYPGELIRIDSGAVIHGSIWTNNQWVYVGKIYIPKEYVAGPFQVK